MGVYDLGLTNDAFWGLTLRQFTMLADRRQEEIKRADRRAGEVVAMLYNVNRDSKKDPDGLTWIDFYPEHREPTPVQTEDQMLAAMNLWTRIKPLQAG